jgi:uncharacterized protein YutE (UPF0331/DUF86 family)
MLDKERISKKISYLEVYSNNLGAMAPQSAEAYKKADNILKSAIERNLQLVSDTELDILALLYKGLGLRIGGDDESIIESLSEKMAKKAINKVKERRTLRNLLIHAYAEIGYDKEAYEQARYTGDVNDFIKEVRRILNS